MKIHDLALDLILKSTKEQEIQPHKAIKFSSNGELPRMITSVLVVLENREATPEEIKAALENAREKGITFENDR